MAKPIKKTELDFWSKRYLKEGQLWGDKPSAAAYFAGSLSDKGSKVFDIGYGYGRDLIYVAEAGHEVSGIDPAEVGKDMAVKLLEDSGHDASGVIVGDFNKAALSVDYFDTVFSHRVLHLIPENEIEAFVEQCAKILKKGGLICIAARDNRDFNPTQMVMHKDGRAEYIHRKGHFISFWNEERFKKAFSKHFYIEGFVEGSEIESVQNPVPSYYTAMLAKRK